MKRITALALAMLALTAVPMSVHSADGPQRTSEHIFTTRCAYCHEAGGWGTQALARRLPESEAQLLNRSSLPPAYTIFVVRRGIGAMPQFTPSELSDAELEALAKWLEDRN